MKFSMFKHQYDVKPITQEGEWADIVKEFLDGQFIVTLKEKRKLHHISLSVFDGYKNGDHGIEMWGLILDYDEIVSIDEALDRFSGFEFLFYTSYNHQVWKKNKDGSVSKPVDKFRIILPFSEPCPFDEWETRKHFVTKFAPNVDPSSAKFVQAYCMPATHPDNVKNTLMIHNKGEFLDWRMFPIKKELPNLATFNGDAAKYDGGNTFKSDDLIKLKDNSLMRAGDVDRHYQCYCPFHNDKSPGSFINKKGNTTYIVCHKCGTARMERDKTLNDVDDDYIEKFLSRRKVSRQTFKPITKDEILGEEEGEREYVIPKTREQRADMLAKRCLKDWVGIMLLYAFEGFGKSYLATLFVKKLKKQVVFACQSNEQARIQAEGFRKQGLSVQFIPGREYRLTTEYKLPFEVTESKNPWDGSSIDENKTKKLWANLGKTEEEQDDIWRESAAAKPNFEDYNIICTTMKRVQVWGNIHAKNILNEFGIKFEDRNRIVPTDTVIFYDDPDVAEFQTLVRWREEFEELKIDDAALEQVVINDREYALRPIKYSIGFGLYDCKIIITTTELLIKELVVRQYQQVYEPPLMPNEKMYAGHITMISSDVVRSKVDGILPPIMERLRKKGFVFNYIADGQGMDINLVNNRGQNSLSDSDSIIEISCPSYDKVTTFIDEFGWTNSDRMAMEVVLTLDAMNQAIGRNSGYRWSDNKGSQRRCVVLCEPKLANALYKHTRYYTQPIDRLKLFGGGRKVDGDSLVAELMWLVRNADVYLRSGIGSERNAFVNDYKSVSQSVASWRRIILKNRVVNALNFIATDKKITSRFGMDFQRKVANLGHQIAVEI